MHRRLFIGVFLVFQACADHTAKESQRNDAIDEDAYAAIDVPTIEDADGVVTAQVIPLAGHIRVVNASAESTIAGARAEFLPGAFDFSTEITLGESPWPLASQNVLADLQIAEKNYVQAFGIPVLLQWTYDETTHNDYRLFIPDVTSMDKTTADNVVVLYKINVPDTSEFNVGLIPGSQLVRADGLISFAARSYGIFQAVTLSDVVDEAIEQKSTKPLDTGNGATSGGPPSAFEVLTDSIKSKPLHGAELRLTWNPAGGASSFRIAIDDDDPQCGSPVKTMENLKVLSTVVWTLEGQNYICVYAVNKNGETPATNNKDLSFKADATIPPTPKGLKSSVSGINVKVEWDAVEDEGLGGFAFYELQIGTTKEGTEQFNGPIPTATSYEFAGFAESGTSYFAKVRAVDKAGNASPWTPLHGPIVQE